MKRRDFVRTAAGLLVPAGLASAAPVGTMIGGPASRLYVEPGEGGGGGSPPANTAAPVVSVSGGGDPTPGKTLSCTTGTWTNTPTSYGYQWYYADGDVAIIGATSSSYLVQASDVGEEIYCVVTAANAAGSASQDSNTVGPVEEAGDGPAYSPLWTWRAAGGTPGNTITGWQEVMSNRVKYSNDIAAPSGASVTAKQSVLASSNWFGGEWLNGLSSLGIGDGTDIWIRQYLYFPSDFQFACGTVSGDRWGNVKWIRLQFSNSETSRNTLQMGSLAGTGFASAPSYATQVGWGGFTDEYGGNGYNGDIASPGAQVTRGSWLAIQSHVRFSTGTDGYIESWINDTYVGRARKNNATTYKTCATGATLAVIKFGDYWNGGPGFDDDFYTDEIIITTETPNTLDLDGRPFISPAHFVGDF